MGAKKNKSTNQPTLDKETTEKLTKNFKKIENDLLNQFNETIKRK
jgi:hypothetical protein